MALSNEDKLALVSEVRSMQVAGYWSIEIGSRKSNTGWILLEDGVRADPLLDIETYVIEKIRSRVDERWKAGKYRVRLLNAENNDVVMQKVFDLEKKDLTDMEDVSGQTNSGALKRTIKDRIETETLLKTYRTISGEDKQDEAAKELLEEKERQAEEFRELLEAERREKEDERRRLDGEKMEWHRQQAQEKQEEVKQRENSSTQFFTLMLNQQQKSSESAIQASQQQMQMFLAMMQDQNKRDSETKEQTRLASERQYQMMIQMMQGMNQPKVSGGIFGENTAQIIPLFIPVLERLMEKPTDNFDKIEKLLTSPTMGIILQKIAGGEKTNDLEKIEKLLGSPVVAKMIEKMTENPMQSVMPQMFNTVFDTMASGMQKMMDLGGDGGENSQGLKKLNAVRSMIQEVTNSVIQVVSTTKAMSSLSGQKTAPTTENPPPQQQMLPAQITQAQQDATQPQQPLELSPIKILELIEKTQPEEFAAWVKAEPGLLDQLKPILAMLDTKQMPQDSNFRKVLAMLKQ